VLPAVQARSQRTQRRILEATEELLAERLFEQVSVQEIAARAGVSVGALYARFASKAALVPCLQERYTLASHAMAKRVMDPRRWEGRPLDVRARVAARFLVRVYRHNRGLLRALFLDWRTQPEKITDADRAARATFFDRLAAPFLACRDEITAVDPDRSVRLAIAMVMATCRDLFLSGNQFPHAVEASDRWLSDELARAFLAYLRAP